MKMGKHTAHAKRLCFVVAQKEKLATVSVKEWDDRVPVVEVPSWHSTRQPLVEERIFSVRAILDIHASEQVSCLFISNNLLPLFSSLARKPG